jgi:hypothetical protein
LKLFSIAEICAASLASVSSSATASAAARRRVVSRRWMYDELRIHDTSGLIVLGAGAPFGLARILSGARRAASAGSSLTCSIVGLREASLPSHTPSNELRSIGMPISASRSMGAGAAPASWSR